MNLDEACAAARRRVHALVDARHYAARRETAAMAESARRSIGQGFRYAIPAPLRRFRERQRLVMFSSDPNVLQGALDAHVRLYLEQSADHDRLSRVANAKHEAIWTDYRQRATDRFAS